MDVMSPRTDIQGPLMNAPFREANDDKIAHLIKISPIPPSLRSKLTEIGRHLPIPPQQEGRSMIRPTTEDREAFSRECPAEVRAAANAMLNRIAEIGYALYGPDDCAWTDLADVALNSAKATMDDSDEWTAEEIAIMRSRGMAFQPNRKIAREIRLESLRLAIVCKLAEPNEIIEMAAKFEDYLNSGRKADIIKSNQFSPYVVPGTQ